MNAPKPPTAWAIIDDDVVRVEVLRCRKYDRTAQVRIGGIDRRIAKSVLFTTKRRGDWERCCSWVWRWVG